MIPTTSSLSKDGNFNILIAEDHKLVRKISRLIVKELYPNAVFYETDSVEELSELYKSVQFNLAVLDVYLSDGNTLSVLPTLKELQPDCGILFFTMCSEKIWGRRALANGADGFLNKKADEDELINAVNIVFTGGKYISSLLQSQIADEVINRKASNPIDRLSNREFEIMLLLLKGRSLTEIGTDLSLQVSTVGTHKTRLFDKLNITTLMELSKIASVYDIGN